MQGNRELEGDITSTNNKLIKSTWESKAEIHRHTAEGTKWGERRKEDR